MGISVLQIGMLWAAVRQLVRQSSLLTSYFERPSDVRLTIADHCVGARSSCRDHLA